jgi:AbrB family looped-hinge helix DNA binding protein
MAIVTVKNKYQVVIPQTVRKQLGINRGDLLEAKVERGKLTYTRKTLIDRIPTNKADRERFFKQLSEDAPDWLKGIWAASKRAGLDKMTMREINAEIAATRREKRGKRKLKQPAK